MKDNGKMSRAHFIEHLTYAWNNKEFKHFYPVTNKNWINTKGLNDGQFSVKCLKEAFDGYFWAGKDFKKNEGRLEELSKELIESLSGNNHSSAHDVCKRIFNWGGVGRGRKTPQWLECHLRNRTLTYSLQDMVQLIQQNDDFSLFENKKYIMNSSITKVISLASEKDFAPLIIYDGRVGAALADFVFRFVQRNNNTCVVEDELLFMWGPKRITKANRTVDGKNPRDPRAGSLKFKNLFSSAKYQNAYHARNMAVASDICRKVAKNLDISPRKLEAALFMWGYDVRSYRQGQ